MNPVIESIPEPPRSGAGIPPKWMSLWTILAIAALIYAIRMAGPDDLADGYHQERAAAYVMDALRNGNWICQYGYYGEVSSKPPMLTWLAALASLPFGQPSWFTLTLPGALATVALAMLIFTAGSRSFGPASGFFGALMYLLSPIGAKQMVLARIDGLFSLTIAITALLAFRAWQTGRGWTWFWLAGAAATLTKGPLGVLLGAIGLFAVFWERRTGFSSSARGTHLPGVILYFAICGGWFALAYAKFGQPLVDVMLGRELVGQIIDDSRAPAPFTRCYLPTLMFLSRYAPWSLLTCFALWRAFKRPAADAQARQFERFLSCWFLGGLLIFSAAAHQRPDLIFPLIPAAALLAGRVAASWLETRPRVMRVLVPVGTALALIGVSINYIYAVQSRPRVQRTAAVKELARMLKTADTNSQQLLYAEAPYALQFYMNTKSRPIDAASAARSLSQQNPVFVATSQPESIRALLASKGATAYVLYRWRGPKREALELLGNRPQLP